MKKKIKKSIKAPHKPLPLYIQELAKLPLPKSQGGAARAPLSSSTTRQAPSVVEQIALILRGKENAKDTKSKALPRLRKARRAKK